MAKILFRRLILVLAAVLLSAAIPALTHANHSWGGYHWARTTGSFTLKLGDNVSSAWDGYLAEASSEWSVSSVLDTAIVAGAVSRVKKCQPTSGRVEVCSSTYGNNGWLGIAQIWISGLHITQGGVKLNDTYFNTAKYNTPAWRRLVMCQEIAHTSGLDHQDETFGNPNLGTCMDYTNDPDGTLANPDQVSNEYPNQHDYDELVDIYTHLDSATTVKQALRNNANRRETSGGELGTGQWGKLRRSTNRGRTELYELDLGRGRKVLTHVIWAEPEEE
ncbi:MAG TPA: hypothetical protein VGL70_19785 [Candidatus Binatia bacterium]|jgi:hypothetical protein